MLPLTIAFFLFGIQRNFVTCKSQECLLQNSILIQFYFTQIANISFLLQDDFSKLYARTSSHSKCTFKKN